MSEENQRRKPIHLTQEEVLGRLPGKIGRVSLDYTHYPGRDLYSDGAVEDQLLSIVKEFSPVEYPGIIEEKKSWPVLYHLSPLRGNIVDWLPIKEGDRVLEIGSGCGAITERLAQKGGEVTCVDLSAKRSQINAQRNSNRENIQIHVGNFSDIEPSLPKDFDYVLLIGVFEYGQSYIHTQTPYEDFLKIVQKHVKDEGHIVIAIENKFGLKYWAGCKEDHLGNYFSGLEGYPEGGSARTFTRQGLEKILKSCGIEEYSFYYPYPDYKFPTVVYSDRRMPQPGELTNNVRNFDRDRMQLFNEKYVFDSIVQDGLFEVFSNSYMVVTGKAPDTGYVKYSNDRAFGYALRTEIADTPEGKRVRKIPLNEEAAGHVRGMKRACELLKERYEGSGLAVSPCILSEDKGYVEFPYVEGAPLETLLDGCLAREDKEGFYRLFDRYFELISYGEEKSVVDYDMAFSNILVDGDNWTVIDYEWTMRKQVPAKEIAFRAVYCYILEEEKRNKLDLDLILKKIGVSQQTAEEYRQKEKRFQKQVTGKRKSMGEICAAIGNKSYDAKALVEHYQQKKRKERIQVFYDRGEGFHEEDSCYLEEVYQDERNILAEISFGRNVVSLRIDPAESICMVKIAELMLNNSEVPLKKKYIETNGKNVREGCIIFDTADPNLTIKVSEFPLMNKNILTVKMEISPVSASMAEDVMQAVKKIF